MVLELLFVDDLAAAITLGPETIGHFAWGCLLNVFRFSLKPAHELTRKQ
jgi:hypothetical protein